MNDNRNQLLMMAIKIKWFPPAWVQIKMSNKKIIYIDPDYLKKYYRNYPMEFKEQVEKKSAIKVAALQIGEVYCFR